MAVLARDATIVERQRRPDRRSGVDARGVVPAARRLGQRRTALRRHRHRELRPGRPRSAACRLRLRHDDAEAWLGGTPTSAATSPSASTCRSGSTTTSTARRSPRTCWGAAQGCAVAVYMTIGTGIGGGVVVDGRRCTAPCIPSTATFASAGGPTTPSRVSARITATASRVSRRDRRSPPGPAAGRRSFRPITRCGPTSPASSASSWRSSCWRSRRSASSSVAASATASAGCCRAFDAATLAALAGYVAALDDGGGRGADRPTWAGRRCRPARLVAVGLDALADDVDRRRRRASRASDRRGRRGDPVLRVPAHRPLRLGRVLHPPRRRAGRPPGGVVPHVAGGRPAVRRRARPLPRRSVGRPRTARPVHRRRCRRRSRHPRPLDPRRPAGVRGGDALRRRRGVGSVSGRSTRPTSSRARTSPTGRSTASSSPTSCSTTCRSGCACSTGRGGRRSSSLTADGTFGEVLSAPFDPQPAVLPPAPAHGSRAPLHDAAVDWVADARSRLRPAAGCSPSTTPQPSTASLARRPWREWLRTYRDHGRGDHYLADPGGQDITVEIALDQFPSPIAVSTQAQFLRRWGIDDLVAEGERGVGCQRRRPGSAGDGDAQPRRRGRRVARSRPAWVPSSSLEWSDALTCRHALRLRSSAMRSATRGTAAVVAVGDHAAVVVARVEPTRRRRRRDDHGGADDDRCGAHHDGRRGVHHSVATPLPSLPPPADEASDPVRALVPSIVAVEERAGHRRRTATGRGRGAHRGAATRVAVVPRLRTLCAVVPVAAPLMAVDGGSATASRWRRQTLTRRDPPGYGDCVSTDETGGFDEGVYQYLAVGDDRSDCRRPPRSSSASRRSPSGCSTTATSRSASSRRRRTTQTSTSRTRPIRSCCPARRWRSASRPSTTTCACSAARPTTSSAASTSSPQAGVYVDLFAGEEPDESDARRLGDVDDVRPTTTG